MKSQRTVYLLLPLVLLIWGLIGWRIWSAAGEPDASPTRLPAVTSTSARADSIRPPTLLLTYADPFRPVPGSSVAVPSPPASYAATVARTPRPAPASSLNLPVRSATPALAATTADWPTIIYLGVIAHAEGKAQVALLAVNKEEMAVKVGRSIQGVQVIRLSRDSVRLGFGKQQRTFYRAATY